MENELAQLFTARFAVDALIDDYCQVVARLEGIPAVHVKERIKEKANTLFSEFKERNTLPAKSEAGAH